MAEVPYKWEVRVAGDILNGLFISTDCLMDLRNKMGQFQEETSAPSECLWLLDYIIAAAQHTSMNGKAAGT